MDFRNQSCSWSFHYKNNPLHLYRPIISRRVTDHGPFFRKRVSHCRLFYQKSHYANLWTCITKNESLWLLVSFHTSAVVFWGGAFFSFLCVWVGRGIHVHIVDLVCQCLVFWVLNYTAKIYLLLRALVESLFTFYNAHLSKLLLLPFTLNN